MHAVLALLVAYAVGCVSFASLVAKLRGVDLRAHGSGNPGATNVGRLLGRGWGLGVLLADMAKGALPVAFLTAPPGDLGLPAALVPGFSDHEGCVLILAAVVLGHVYPVSMGLKGGKGVATLIGGALAFDWITGLAAIAVHLILKKGLGFVSLASVGLAWSLPAVQLVRSLADEPSEAPGSGVLALLALLVTWRHKENFARIRQGREDRYDDSDHVARSLSEQHGEGRSPR